jgi:hypothetical protein
VSAPALSETLAAAMQPGVDAALAAHRGDGCPDPLRAERAVLARYERERQRLREVAVLAQAGLSDPTARTAAGELYSRAARAVTPDVSHREHRRERDQRRHQRGAQNRVVELARSHVGHEGDFGRRCDLESAACAAYDLACADLGWCLAGVVAYPGGPGLADRLRALAEVDEPTRRAWRRRVAEDVAEWLARPAYQGPMPEVSP